MPGARINCPHPNTDADLRRCDLTASVPWCHEESESSTVERCVRGVTESEDLVVTRQPRTLERPPLAEAILEIRWRLDGADPAHPLFAGALAKAVVEDYPVQERLDAANLPDEMTPHIVKFRMRKSVGGWPLIQAGPGIVTLNSVDDYQWEDYYRRALNLWDSLGAAYAFFNNNQLPEVDSLVLRYVNAIPFDGEDATEVIDRQLHVGIGLPSGLVEHETAGSTAGVALAAAYPLRKHSAVGTLRIQLGQRSNRPSLIWDLTAESKLPTPATRELFDDWLSYCHGVLEHWFFALIEGDLLDSFKQVTP